MRAALTEAIRQLKEPEEVEEPRERDLREAIHLDHDRKDVSGTPPIADVIFDKIDHTDVFIADTTPVAELTRLNPIDGELPVKKVINPNVAIEYGYAVRVVTDRMILLVQNTHYGNRDDLPFDLKHKGGPIQYRLAPDATPAERKAEMAKLAGTFVIALRACLVTLGRSGPQAPKFEPIPFTSNRAFFWQPGEILARYDDSHPFHPKEDDIYEYSFDEPRALYARLIPTRPLAEQLTFSKLMNILELRRVRLMTRTINSGLPVRNKYGAILYESQGTSRTPLAMTQLHRNGEIWAVTQEFWGHHANRPTIAMGDVEGRLVECLQNSVQIATAELSLEFPFEFEVGIVGLANMRLSRPIDRLHGYGDQTVGPIYDDECYVSKVLNEPSQEAHHAIVVELLRKVWALAGIDV